MIVEYPVPTGDPLRGRQSLPRTRAEVHTPRHGPTGSSREEVLRDAQGESEMDNSMGWKMHLKQDGELPRSWSHHQPAPSMKARPAGSHSSSTYQYPRGCLPSSPEEGQGQAGPRLPGRTKPSGRGQGDEDLLMANRFGQGDVLVGLPGSCSDPGRTRYHGCSPSHQVGVVPTTYRIEGTSPADETDPACHSSLGHPMVSRLFQGVTYEEMRSRGCAIGVARSNNVLLKPMVNETHSALSDSFVTHGMRFTLSPGLIQRAEEMGGRADHPFDDRVLRMIGSWMEVGQGLVPRSG